MTQPWFDPDLYAWIPGTVYGVAVGLLGVVVGVLAQRGRARGFVINAWIAAWLVGLALLAVGVAALLQGQPWGIWYGFLLPGVIGAAVVGGNYFTIAKRYREIEQRRLAARDLG
jgi:peptidoglycan/LPS O-acetylase OafA/YrhL